VSNFVAIGVNSVVGSKSPIFVDKLVAVITDDARPILRAATDDAHVSDESKYGVQTASDADGDLMTLEHVLAETADHSRVHLLCRTKLETIRWTMEDRLSICSRQCL